MTKKIATRLVRTGTILFGLASLALLAVGVYQQAWYGGFGVVLVITALVCNVAAFLGASGGNLMVISRPQAGDRPGRAISDAPASWAS